MMCTWHFLLKLQYKPRGAAVTCSLPVTPAKFRGLEKGLPKVIGRSDQFLQNKFLIRAVPLNDKTKQQRYGGKQGRYGGEKENSDGNSGH